ncbi:hypothetical protein RJ639_004353 [Escallonia herrerae]|uniref:Integrase catalytic domain-containing protein n=1 Tax=Escallonia herrerae TaxID=1293975 RepID=A0AA89B1S1_9ASTE|nr:hypothetical protein RJ639_004353 [Escallonia herrerae]
MANSNERIDALEAQIRDMIKSDPDAPGILKQFSLRLDALEVNLEATDNARYAENMEWEDRFQELQDRVEHHARHVEGIDWESKFQELQDRVELLSRAVVNTPAGGGEHSSRPRVPEPKSYGGAPEDTAQLFFKHVVKYWGMPQDIVSDRDSRFTENFWTELFKLFGSQLSMSSSYHPELDGQTERFNPMLEEYLRHFVGATQKNWVKRLDVAQLCFKSRKSSSTGNNAFEIMNGQQLLLPHTVNVPNAGKSPRAIIFNEEWRQNIDLAHSYLQKVARRIKKHADKNRRSQEFNVGDKVMIKILPHDRKFLRGRDSHLLQKYEGPLTIVKKIGKMAYKVDPPHWWSRQLHPVFHVNMLKAFYEDTADPSRGQIKRQGLKPKTAGKRVAEAILNDRVIIASRKLHQEYLVKWQRYMEEKNTWE